ncbi:MAG: 50S ribosomal protein L44e [Candidatus Bathyarchaeia archaeon]
MKAPKTMRAFCPKCNAHTEQAVSLYKAGQRRAAKGGERRHEEKKKGYGGQKYPRQRNLAKTTRKHSLKLQCKVCGYIQQKEGIRLKRLEVA